MGSPQDSPRTERRAAIFLALLPGTLTRPGDLEREGFAAAVQASAIDAEVAIAEARAAWFADGSMVQRLHDGVVAPARARGHARIWLAGISLGALAALAYAARHQDTLERVVLISPYPGTREVLREIDAGGGARAWSAGLAPAGDLEREAWRWLAQGGGMRLPVHCYFASGDRFAAGQRQMAQLLAPARVRELPGGHDWAAWRALWAAFLADQAAA